MLRTMCAALVAALVCAGAAVAAPLEAYGRLPAIEDAQISPDGTMIALVVTDGEKRNVIVRRLSETQAFVGVAAGEAKLRGLDWAGNQHLLITVSRTTTMRDIIANRGEYFVTSVFELATRRQTPLINPVSGSEVLNISQGSPRVVEQGGRTMVFMQGVKFVDGHGRLSVFRTQIGTRDTSVIATGGRDTEGWMVGPSGQVVAQVTEVERSGAWQILVPDGRGWRALRGSPAYGERPGVMGFGRDGRSLLVGGVEGGAWRLREVDIAADAWSEPIVGGEPDGLLFHPRTYALAGLRYLEGDEEHEEFFDAAIERLWERARSAFPGRDLRIVSASDDLNRLVVLADSPSEGPAYALVDFTANRATWLGGVHAGIGPGDVHPVEYLTYKAADGLEIGAYLTTPKGRNPSRLPLIVLPHGGPQSRDSGGFDWWAQALASRGYAVLQPNFRGSDGYGQAFVEKGHGQWGRKMQTDLSDGVRHLAREGMIDPARVCIAGGSYGGYAALAGATIDRGVYRCAASVNGVTDLAAQMRHGASNSGYSAIRYWSRFMGADGPGDPVLRDLSPLHQVARAEIPVLLIHGRDDTVVPFSQSADMERALQRAGKDVTLVALPGEDHWLSRGETRLAMLQALVAFLEAKNPPN